MAVSFLNRRTKVSYDPETRILNINGVQNEITKTEVSYNDSARLLTIDGVTHGVSKTAVAYDEFGNQLIINGLPTTLRGSDVSFNGATQTLTIDGNNFSVGGSQVSYDDNTRQLTIDGIPVTVSKTAVSFNSSTNELTIDGVSNNVGGSLTSAVTQVAGNYGATNLDQTILVDASSGPVTISLFPVALSLGHTLNIKKIDGSSNTVTIDGNAAQTIDGLATQQLLIQYENLTIQSTASEWRIL